jgi:hypothetical protein
MYQVTFSPDNANGRLFDELTKTLDYALAVKTATDKVTEYFGTEAWKANKEQDSDFLNCEDWFCYDPANTTKEAVIVAINFLPLTSASTIERMVLDSSPKQDAGYVHGVPELLVWENEGGKPL